MFVALVDGWPLVSMVQRKHENTGNNSARPGRGASLAIHATAPAPRPAARLRSVRVSGHLLLAHDELCNPFPAPTTMRESCPLRRATRRSRCARRWRPRSPLGTPSPPPGSYPKATRRWRPPRHGTERTGHQPSRTMPPISGHRATPRWLGGPPVAAPGRSARPCDWSGRFGAGRRMPPAIDC